MPRYHGSWTSPNTHGIVSIPRTHGSCVSNGTHGIVSVTPIPTDHERLRHYGSWPSHGTQDHEHTPAQELITVMQMKKAGQQHCKVDTCVCGC